jgi:hypothetical protein
MTGKRVSLAAALQAAPGPAPSGTPPVEQQPPVQVPTPLRAAPAPEAPSETSEGGGEKRGEEQLSVSLPRWRQLERKEARLQPQQWDELSRLTRQLNRTRAGRGERITDNTLIRVAIDLLLERRDVLRGTTEEELRSSVLRDPRSL